MAKVYVEGFTQLAKDRNTYQMSVPLDPPVFQDILDTTSGADFTAALPDTVTMVRVHTDGIVSLKIGAGVTATVNDGRMAAGQTEYRGIQAGAGHRVSAITNT